MVLRFLKNSWNRRSSRKSRGRRERRHLRFERFEPRRLLTASDDGTVADDPAADETADPSADVDLGVTPRSGPTAVSFSSVRDRLSEETGTTRRKWLGNLQVADDGVGAITYALSGVYADVFELDGPTLYLKAGVSLNYGVQQSYTVMVSAWDETVPEDLPVSLEYTLHVTDVEYTPLLHPSSPLVLPTVLEDAAGPTTGGVSDSVLVADILDGFRDEDGDEPGIAIVGTNLHGGTLWFSTDDKATWQDVGAVSESSARVLYADASTYLHFEPAADFSGTVSDVMTIRAWGRKGGYANGEAGVSTAVVATSIESIPQDVELLGPSDLNARHRTERDEMWHYENYFVDVVDVSNPAISSPVIASIRLGDQDDHDRWMIDVHYAGGVYAPDGSALFFTGTDYGGGGGILLTAVDVLEAVDYGQFGLTRNVFGEPLTSLVISPDGSTLFAFYYNDYGRPLLVDVYDISDLSNIQRIDILVGGVENYHWARGSIAADGSLLYGSSQQGVDAFDLTPYQWFSPRQHQVGVEVVAVNDAPTALQLHDVVESVPEDIDTTAGVRVADLEVVDDELGTNLILLTGADAEFFEVAGSQLFLKAGTQLDYNTKDHYAVTVSVCDPTVQGRRMPLCRVIIGEPPAHGRPLQEIESNGDVVLARDEDGFLFANGRAVRLFGAGQQGLFMREWTILSAETVGGQNYLITRHESGAMHRFGADSTWAMYGSELMTVPDDRGPSSNRSLNALSAESREMAFGGGSSQPTPRNEDAPSIDPGAESGSSSEPVPEFDDYQAVAAEVTQHGREILLINRDRTAAVELLFDDDWIFIGVLKSFEINPGHIRRLEQKFFADLTAFVGQQEA